MCCGGVRASFPPAFMGFAFFKLGAGALFPIQSMYRYWYCVERKPVQTYYLPGTQIERLLSYQLGEEIVLYFHHFHRVRVVV